MIATNRTTCPACGHSEISHSETAIISPWILKICKKSYTFRQTRYFLCDFCKSGYFETAYTDEELHSIYSEYRSTNYFIIRSTWDRSYTKELNSGLSSDADWMHWRQLSVESVLLKNGIDLESKIVCVDIGGGEGGVIPNFPNGKKYVLDSNENLKLPKDVSRISQISNLAKIQANIIMCCGLLEHLNHPEEFLNDLKSNSPSTELYYFEVPAGVPTRRKQALHVSFFLRFLTSSPFLWNFANKIDAYTYKIFKIHAMPLRLSEHLNFFSERGLHALMQRANLKVLTISQFETNSNLPGGKSLAFTRAWQVLAVPKVI
jgi:Methyltransferase domain